MFNWASNRKKPQPLPAQRSGPAADRFEIALLASVAAGRRADFDRLYRLYHPRLGRFLAHLLQRPDAVDAVLNDTMLAVWQRAAEFQGSSRVSTWVYGIAYRRAMQVQSRLGATLNSAPADAGPGASQPAGLDPLREQLRCALGELSLEHRTVVELCFFHDMAYAEIAQVMDCPPETVKARMFHARRRLRLLLDDLNAQAQGAAG